MAGMSDLRLEYFPHHFLCLCGLIAHTLLLVAFIKDSLKCFRNSTSYLIANLAVSDLMYSLVSPVRIYLPNNFLKDIGLDVFVYVSGISLIAVALDRYLMVTYPVRYRYFVNKTRMAVFITFIWLLGFGYPLKRWIIGPDKFDTHVVNGAALLGIPSVVMLHLKTFQLLRKQSRCVSTPGTSLPATVHNNKRIMRENHFVKTLVILSSVTVVTYTPRIIFEEVVNVNFTKEHTLDWHSPDMAINILTLIIATIFIANFVVNPFICNWRLPKYRRTFFRLFCKSSRTVGVVKTFE